MGACVSTSNRPSKSRKYYLRSKKRRGKVSAAVSDAPRNLSSNSRTRYAVRECVCASSSRRRSEVSNLSVHRTQLQWHHSDIDRNVTCQEEAWFDSASILDSDSDDDSPSVHGDGFLPVSNAVGDRMLQCENDSHFVDAVCKYEECNDSSQVALVVEERFKRKEDKAEEVLNEAEGKEVDKSFNSTVDAISRVLVTDTFPYRNKVVEEISCDIFKSSNEDAYKVEEKSHENTLKQMKILGLSCTVPSVNFSERISQIPSASHLYLKRKSAFIRLSLKRRSCDGDETTEFCSSKRFCCHPIPGLSIPSSILDPSAFTLRGKCYFRDKKISAAPELAPYTLLSVDLFLFPHKVNHIEKAQSLLAVNIQLPTYPAAMLVGDGDRKGMSLVLYFMISDNYDQEIPLKFHDSTRRFIDYENEKVKGFPVDSIVPFKEQLQIMAGIDNLEDLHLSGVERNLLKAYNEKPVLSHPQHSFYQGSDYFEIDLDRRWFSNISRTGLQGFRECMKHGILDVGLTIQAQKQKELSERVLCCLKLNKIEFVNHGNMLTIDNE